MSDKTLISIEEHSGIKYVHYLGYGYITDDDTKPYRWLEYTGLSCPLNEAILYGISKWEEDNQEFVTQYITDMTEKEFDALLQSNNYPLIKNSDISSDIPVGFYFID